MRGRQILEVRAARGEGSLLSAFMSRVYAWMMLGILVTGFVSFAVGQNPALVARIFMNRPFFWMLVIVQLLSVVYLSAMIHRISTAAAAITFVVYSGLTGLTLSMIFLVYSGTSIASTFFTTALAFGGLSAFGYVTKRNLGPIGSFCVMGLFGMLAVILLSFLIPSLNGEGAQLTISAMGVLIFSGLTAYDTQRIKNLVLQSPDAFQQQAIYGALILYLDFINLFVNLLRLMGDRK